MSFVPVAGHDIDVGMAQAPGLGHVGLRPLGRASRVRDVTLQVWPFGWSNGFMREFYHSFGVKFGQAEWPILENDRKRRFAGGGGKHVV